MLLGFTLRFQMQLQSVCVCVCVGGAYKVKEFHINEELYELLVCFLFVLQLIEDNQRIRAKRICNKKIIEY